MQGVTKLVEHRLCLIPSKERWLTLRRLSIVANVENQRFLLAVTTLLEEGTHPRTTTLCRTTEVIAIEERQLLAVSIYHVKHLHILVVSRNILTLTEAESIDTMSGIEDTIYEYRVKIEVRLHVVIREAILILLHLCRIIEAIVRLKWSERVDRLTSRRVICVSLFTR